MLKQKFFFLFGFLLFLSVFFIILTIQGFFQINNEVKKLNNDTSSFLEFNAELGYSLKPSQSFTWHKITNREGDKSSTVTIDKYGRRITLSQKHVDGHLLFFGCSYIFGDNLKDENTIPYLINTFDTTRNAYNYALSGYTTSQMLPLLENNIPNHSLEKQGIALYSYIDHHINRNIFDSYALKWTYNFPFYLLKEDSLINQGSFYTHRPIRTCFYKGLSNYKRLYNSLYKLHFFRLSDKKQEAAYKLLAKIVAQSKKVYLQTFPNSSFYVVIFPNQKNTIVPYLKNENIGVINLSDKITLKKEDLQTDGYHPNELGTKKVAQAIYDVLKLKKRESVPL